MRIKFLGDQTLIRVDGVKTQVKGGDVVYVDKEYGEALLRTYSAMFEVAHVETPKPKKTAAKVTNYSKAKK